LKEKSQGKRKKKKEKTTDGIYLLAKGGTKRIMVYFPAWIKVCVRGASPEKKKDADSFSDGEERKERSIVGSQGPVTRGRK